jgi:alpha-D-ribose 1-methylphosphonate 5-triphosphate diphosphatase PhnM
MLFAELLGLEAAPRAFTLKHFDIYGKINELPAGETTFGPLVMFSLVDNHLACLESVFSSRDKGRFDRLKAVAAGDAKAAASGQAVFDRMKSKVLATDITSSEA